MPKNKRGRLTDPAFLAGHVPPGPGMGQKRQKAADPEAEAYEDWIRALPCLACGHTPAGEVHHLMRWRRHNRERPARWSVPLCAVCHRPTHTGSLHHHGNEDAWFAERNIPAGYIAQALWALRDLQDVAAAVRIIGMRERPQDATTLKERE